MILAQGFEEIEAVAPIDILRRGNIEVIVAGLDNINIASARNLTVHCSDVLSNCMNDHFDAVVLPGGGKGTEHLSKSKEVLWLVKKLFNEGKVVAAICASPAVILAPLDILDGKKATCYPGMQESFHKTTTYLDTHSVIDGNIVTGRAAGSSVEFGLSVLEALTDKSHADRVRASIFA